MKMLGGILDPFFAFEIIYSSYCVRAEFICTGS